MAWDKRFPGCNLHLPGRKAGRMDGYKDLRTAVAHTEGVYRTHQDAIAVARYVHARDIGYHYLIDDQHDKIVSLYDYDVGSRSVRGGLYPWKSANRRGTIRIQICWVGYKYAIPTRKRGPRYHDFVDWLRDRLGIPSVTPVDWDHPRRRWSAWEQPGWMSHANAPIPNNHTDGRGTDPKTLWTPNDRECEPCP